VRAVLDVNVLIAALISRTGAPARLVELWHAGDFELIASEKLLTELERALAYPKVRERVSADDAGRFLLLIRELAEVVSDPEAPPPIRSADPGDDYVLALAAHERAHLVSGDDHLLALRERAAVFSPREFVALVGERRGERVAQRGVGRGKRPDPRSSDTPPYVRRRCCGGTSSSPLCRPR
jgi:putative PIN family toxin of toxin-antitoxin system